MGRSFRSSSKNPLILLSKLCFCYKLSVNFCECLHSLAKIQSKSKFLFGKEEVSSLKLFSRLEVSDPFILKYFSSRFIQQLLVLQPASVKFQNSRLHSYILCGRENCNLFKFVAG